LNEEQMEPNSEHVGAPKSHVNSFSTEFERSLSGLTALRNVEHWGKKMEDFDLESAQLAAFPSPSESCNEQERAGR
jgi:hypothetical protein